MARSALAIVITAFVLSLFLQWAWPSSAPPQTSERPRFLALVTPRHMHPLSRYVVYAGIEHVPQDARIIFRTCGPHGTCVASRTTHIEADDTWWGWLGALELPPGTYDAELMVQAPFERIGYRTVANASWSVRVGE